MPVRRKASLSLFRSCLCSSVIFVGVHLWSCCCLFLSLSSSLSTHSIAYINKMRNRLGRHTWNALACTGAAFFGHSFIYYIHFRYAVALYIFVNMRAICDEFLGTIAASGMPIAHRWDEYYFICLCHNDDDYRDREREKEHFTFYRLTECSASAFVELHGAKWRIWQKGREYFALSNIYYIYSINGEIFMCLSFMSIVALVYGNIISSISTKYLCSMIVSGWKRQIRPVKCRLPIVWRYFIPDGLRWLAIGKMRN